MRRAGAGPFGLQPTLADELVELRPLGAEDLEVTREIETGWTSPFVSIKVATFWVCYVIILRLAAIPQGMVPARWGPLVWGLTSSAALLVLTLLVLRREGRAAGDIGLRIERGSAERFATGALIGFGLYACILLGDALLVGPIHLAPVATPDRGAIVRMTSIYLGLSAMEELGFRGYPLRTLVARLGPWRAQAIVAVAFGLSHFMYGWSWRTIALGVIPSAVLFGVAALTFRGLAAPIGLHAALNLARWSAGETGTPGLWTVAIDERMRGGLRIVAPLVSIVITGLTAAALWRWHLRRSQETVR